MLELPTVLLRHTTAAGTHFDWMIADPAQQHRPEGRLWTARVGRPSSAWSSMGRFDLTPLAPHRRAYLTYQGPISGGRGRVQRVDAGRVRVLLWRPGRIVLDVTLDHFAGRVDLRPVGPNLWRAAVRPLSAAAHPGLRIPDPL